MRIPYCLINLKLSFYLISLKPDLIVFVAKLRIETIDMFIKGNLFSYDPVSFAFIICANIILFTHHSEMLDYFIGGKHERFQQFNKHSLRG